MFDDFDDPETKLLIFSPLIITFLLLTFALIFGNNKENDTLNKNEECKEYENVEILKCIDEDIGRCNEYIKTTQKVCKER